MVEGGISVEAELDGSALTVSGETVDVAEGSEVTITIEDSEGNQRELTAVVDADGKYTVTTDATGLIDGELTITAEATDRNGNALDASTTAELDLVAGGISVEAELDGSALTVSGETVDVAEGSEVTITIEDSEGNQRELTAVVDADGKYTVTTDVTGLVDGPINVDVTATDRNGNELDASTTAELDLVEGGISVEAELDGSALTVSGETVDVAEGSEVTITIEDSEGNQRELTAVVDADGKYTVTTDATGLIDGELTITAEATDRNGNELDASTTVELDLSETPSATIVIDEDSVIIGYSEQDAPIIEQTNPGLLFGLLEVNALNILNTGTQAITVGDINGDVRSITITSSDLLGLKLLANTNQPFSFGEIDGVTAQVTTKTNLVSELVDGVTGLLNGLLRPIIGTNLIEVNLLESYSVTFTASDGGVLSNQQIADLFNSMQFNSGLIDAGVLNNVSITATDSLGNSATSNSPSLLSINLLGSLQNSNEADEIETVTGETTISFSGHTEGDSASLVKITVSDEQGNTVTTTASVDENGQYNVEGLDISSLDDGTITVDAKHVDHNGDDIFAAPVEVRLINNNHAPEVFIKDSDGLLGLPVELRAVAGLIDTDLDKQTIAVVDKNENLTQVAIKMGSLATVGVLSNDRLPFEVDEAKASELGLKVTYSVGVGLLDPLLQPIVGTLNTVTGGLLNLLGLGSLDDTLRLELLKSYTLQIEAEDGGFISNQAINELLSTLVVNEALIQAEVLTSLEVVAEDSRGAVGTGEVSNLAEVIALSSPSSTPLSLLSLVDEDIAPLYSEVTDLIGENSLPSIQVAGTLKLEDLVDCDEVVDFGDLKASPLVLSGSSLKSSVYQGDKAGDIDYSDVSTSSGSVDPLDEFVKHLSSQK